MKELITEEQADLIILCLSIGVTLAGLIFGFYKSPRSGTEQQKAHWAHAVIFSLIGPAIWLFWKVYNSIENYYGLDSLKALKINFLIAIALGTAFYFLFTFAPRWILKIRSSSSRH